jgi:hypothetical protein
MGSLPQPVFLNPAEMPLMLAAMARFTSCSLSPSGDRVRIRLLSKTRTAAVRHAHQKAGR